ncbi:MAG TPA: glycosyltransferase family 39 protein [Anaerolineales bacterium]|nr:glycosyltransferase family 39 protein [Anaerolineales bacterium]
MYKKTYQALIGIILLALLLRLVGLFSRPIWYDEAFSILFASKGFSAMLYGTITPGAGGAADIHPLGYYTLLWGWINLFGNSVTATRIFSILINLLTLVLVFKIADHLFDNKTALVAAFLFAVLPVQIHYAQEVRMYALLSFWLLLATYAFLRARTGNWLWWIPFSISSALAQHTHNLAAFFLVPLALTPLFQKDWKTLRSLTISGLAALGLYAPWMILLPSQLAKVNSFYWVERPGLERLFTLLLFYLPHLPLFEVMLAIGLLCALLLFALAGFQTYLAHKSSQPSIRKGLWTAYLSFAPPLLLWLSSQIFPIYIERALLPSQAIFCIWLAWAFTQTRAPKFIQISVAIMIGICSVLGIYEHNIYKGFPYGDFHAINLSLQSRIQSGDIILHSNKLSYLPAFYFDPDIPQSFIIDPAGSSGDTLAPATRNVLQVHEFADLESATAGAKRVWFIIYQKSLDEYAEADLTHPHLDYLNKNYTLDSIEELDDIRLYLYVEKVP